MGTKLLHHPFQNNALANPSAIAISTLNREFTYGELESLSNNLALRLIEQGAKRNKLIAIIMEKGWEQVVAVLGVAKSGAAYLPINATESKERIKYLLEIGEIDIILTQSKYEGDFSWNINTKIIAVDTLPIISEKLTIPIVNYSNEDLAYVIFTSGSTGSPKGVMISHLSAINTIEDINKRFKVNFKDKIFAISDLAFDLSVYDIFGTLASGGTIVVTDALHAKNPISWDKILFEKKITVWNSVPALLEIFIEYLKRKYPIVQHSLRLILLSGDWIPVNLPQKIYDTLGNVKIISLGGATEASIWSILYPIKKLNPRWKSIPYGKPMKNQSFYILNKKLNPIPKGKKGELFIGGVGIAQGYWRDKKRTSAQFINHPKFGYLYKTGDLGRYLPDNNIEFLGRVDFQVKISGYRIEINAIEKNILDFSNIKKAVVIPINHGHRKKLVAYITLNTNMTNLNKKNYAAIQHEQIISWKKIYENLYKKNSMKHCENPIYNTTGWISSYLNEPIPQIQMQEWVNNTIKRISQLNPKSVLEIGCGTGLLIFQLAKLVSEYDATDFSKNALEYVRTQINQLNISNVNLFNQEANAINQFKKKYDTIIINSVIQYFPSINYFVEVLNQAIDRTQSGGFIFIGDIRSLSHIKEFHSSTLLTKNISAMTYKEYMAVLNKAVEEDDELLIDHNFFYALKNINPKVTHFQILLKEGKFHNEMNCFRYDVILYIDHDIKFNKEKIPEYQWHCESLPDKKLRSILSTTNKKLFVIKNIPNNRISGLDNIFHDEFDTESWLQNYRTHIMNSRNQALDPEVIHEISAEYNYNASISWSEEKPKDCCDVIFEKKSLVNRSQIPVTSRMQKNNANLELTSYANTPITTRSHQILINQLKKFLSSRLSSYMIPHNFIILKEIPINANGKIDRALLPKMLQSHNRKKYVRPATSIQKKLANIWKNILGVNKIGIHDNFYDLGGTSLLAIQLIIDIDHTFNITLSMQEINSCISNIERLSHLVSTFKKDNKHLKKA